MSNYSAYTEEGKKLGQMVLDNLAQLDLNPRGVFVRTKEEKGLVVLRFDGIYMDSRIYVNGVQAGEWKYGYTTFEVDVTNLLKRRRE